MIRSALIRLHVATRHYFRNTEGTLSVEAAIIFPALCWIYVGSFVWFDAFRMQNVNLRATYTVSDMISREPDKVTPTAIGGLDDIYDYLTYGDHPTQMRLSVLECTANCDDDDARVLEVCWSKGSVGRAELVTADLAAYEGRVPLFPQGDELIMTETFMIYNPAFNVGLGAQTFENVVFTRPRLAPQLKYGLIGGLPDNDLSCANN